MMMSTEAMKSLLKERGKLVESYLATCLDGQEMPPRLRESMLYSLQAGGKRLRPVLCLSCAAPVSYTHLAAGRASSKGSGSTACPRTIRERCRCGPVTLSLIHIWSSFPAATSCSGNS